MINGLKVRGPFDFEKAIRRPLARPSKLFIVRMDDVSYTRAIRVQSRAIPVTVSVTPSHDDVVLHWTMPDDVSFEESMHIETTIRRMFCVDEDVEAFYETMSRRPMWNELINRFYGLRPILDGDLFESMVNVIIGQQLNVKFASTLVERLIDLGDERVEWEGSTLAVFPSPERVASWAYEDLRALSFSQRKAEYVIDFARAVVDGRVNLSKLWTATEEEIYETLLPLRGIGRWTVECVLLFGLGRRDVLPAADIGLQNAIHKLYGITPRPDEDEVRRLAELWRPWRSWATYYLWQSLNE
ncbi:DNA-3-methyladenine glycosylase family protein [Alicyclobacillus acidiphilus]|uniref:DNA-3-methyladenine glycosylase family protein n=1 Tax=Alicyclobacillus acidiphilus TaxID=182455 RepID=UPI0008296A9B|nr:DNA-3-methyladenine glycosylase [Alicyclobacillus acidiphilus]